MAALPTTEMLDCIRFYMGDPQIVARGDFRGGPKAYNTINALLHLGVQNELDKLREGRVLEIYDRAHLISYLRLIETMDRAMSPEAAEQTCTWRVDRLHAVETLRARGEIEGFYSTCKRGFLPEYAHTKADVALMEMVRAPGVPCLDFEALFGAGYAKPEEAEILLPFGAVVRHVEELPLSESEKTLYTDLNGEPPRGKFRIHLAPPTDMGGSDADTWWAAVTSEEAVQHARRCLTLLRDTRQLPPADMDFYCTWKKHLQYWLAAKRAARAVE